MSLALSVGLASAHASADDTVSAGQAYQLGLEARTARDYATMLTQWRRAAANDHLPAQEALASALMVGTPLYGDAAPADWCEAARWARAAAAQGSVVGMHQQQVLNGLRDLPEHQRQCPPATP